MSNGRLGFCRWYSPDSECYQQCCHGGQNKNATIADNVAWVAMHDGGELVPEKCFWYLIDFEWHNQQWKYKKAKDTLGQLSVQQPNSGRIIIPRLEPEEAWRTLGVWLALDGNDGAEVKHLTEVVAEWDKKMARAHLSRAGAEFSLWQVLIPKLTYPLIATNLNESQCSAILQPVLIKALLSMGINWHFPWAVAHSPQSHHSLDIPNSFTEQLIMHMLTLLRFGWQKDDPMGHLLHANMEAFCLEVGLSGQLFGMPLTIIPCMSSSWFTQTWQYCKMHDIDITTDIMDFEPTRYQDKELMRIFIHFGATGQDLASLNRCWMYIHAIYLSDICNGSRTAIDNCFGRGRVYALWSTYGQSQQNQWHWNGKHGGKW